MSDPIPINTGSINAAPPVPPERAGARLDRYLAEALDFSRSRLKALIEQGHVRLGDATIADPSHKIKPGDVYQLHAPEAASAEPLAQDMPLNVVFEDAHLIVIDKPAGLVVHPAPGNPDHTLVNALLHHCGDSLAGIGGVKRPGIVHRIDKDTSGLLVAAKTDAAHHGLAELFARHDIEREYQALVWGLPNPLQGRIEGAIGRDPRDRKRMAVRGDNTTARNSKPAVTHYAVERTFRDAAGQPYAALIRCRLETGRTHQIRVHLTSKGHALVGDPVYGRARSLKALKLGGAARDALAGFQRQALHAASLGFVHPVTGADLRFESPLPADFADLLAALTAG
ncbi:RluA family pseudouridine synthase [Ferrovibrio sp.]|uniref:RluA family pseudouridine synthase n=1 Tax=Ferrovibrio sp. TaxID=1917215 RepID=UPI0025BD2034|nr:RluA family pseudouridine synthase [Ferrovibrio sp.]